MPEIAPKPRKNLLNLSALSLIIWAFILSFSVAQAEEKDHTLTQLPEVVPTATVYGFIHPRMFTAKTNSLAWSIKEVVAVQSMDASVGVVGYASIEAVDKLDDGGYLLTMSLVRQSRKYFIRQGDGVIHLPLIGGNENYKGSTDLIIGQQLTQVSSRYKSLVILGVSSGETAETLWEKEYLFTFYGQVYYGLTEAFTLTTIVPGYFIGAPNLGGKLQLYKSDSTAVAVSLMGSKIPDNQAATMNVTLMWDSISSDSSIAHTSFSLAVVSFDNATDTTAVKALGTSSFQTGYEFILNNWDRVIFGPSYNFEKKALGGYVSYYMIWDHFHLGTSLNSTNISSLRYSAQDGYYLLLDAYWRY